MKALPASSVAGRLAALLLMSLPLACALAGERSEFLALPGGLFRSALRFEDARDGVRVAPFLLMRSPVTNAGFLSFVRTHPAWRRDRAPSVFAESRYLSHWQDSAELGPQAGSEQPVTWVSWFAAAAYCESLGARLPNWSEWEYAAAADETRADARDDPAWRERILAWYSRPSTTALSRVGQQAPDVHGIHDLHGLVWEWTGDFSSLLVSGDNRNQGDADNTRFCGAGAISMEDSSDYAVMMRVAMLSALEGANVTGNLGFRCAKDIP